jgi:glucosamine--fructose-6-phosphate aminotransferase (isomerizing)
MSNPFRADIAAQSAVVRSIAAAVRPGGKLAAELHTAVGVIGDRERPVLLVGMGSSLHAARTSLPRFASVGRFAVALDAGEFLHFGLDGVPADAVVIAISQSGRSAETAAVVERLRATRADLPIVAIVNEPGTPLARLATTTVMLRAGREAAVATRTFVAAVVVLQLLVDALADTTDGLASLEPFAAILEQPIPDEPTLARATDRLGATRAIEIVGRGPTLGLAHYAALTIKETAAFPAEAIAGGAFRHGPFELVDAPAGAIVLVPSGPTGELASRLAAEIAAFGWETWAIGSAANTAGLLGVADRLLVTVTTTIEGPLADIAAIVPLQRFAAAMAVRRGRVPGLLLRGTKVTETQ